MSVMCTVGKGVKRKRRRTWILPASDHPSCSRFFSVIVVLFLSLIGRGEAECLPSYGHPPSTSPTNRNMRLPFCEEHAKRTCCTISHGEEKLKEFAGLYFGVVELSPRCEEAGKRVLCAACDGDVGEGFRGGGKNNPTLCHDFCDQWFTACDGDWFTAAESGSSFSIRPCRESDAVCSRAASIVGDGSAFCEAMGYPSVGAAEPVASSLQSPCYNGVPAALLRGPGEAVSEEDLKKERKTTRRKYAESSTASSTYASWVRRSYKKLRNTISRILSRIPLPLALALLAVGAWLGPMIASKIRSGTSRRGKFARLAQRSSEKGSGRGEASPDASARHKAAQREAFLRKVEAEGERRRKQESDDRKELVEAKKRQDGSEEEAREDEGHSSSSSSSDDEDDEAASKQ